MRRRDGRSLRWIGSSPALAWPITWFPSTHEWAADPDYPWCGSNTDAGEISQHVLRAHWPPSRRLRGNHCRDGVQDFGETGIDVGGRCPQEVAYAFCAAVGGDAVGCRGL